MFGTISNITNIIFIVASFINMITLLITMIISNIIIVILAFIINTIWITSIVVIANIIKIFKCFMNIKASRNMFYSRPVLSSILSLFITLSSILFCTIFYSLFFTFFLISSLSFFFLFFSYLHFTFCLSSPRSLPLVIVIHFFPIFHRMLLIGLSMREYLRPWRCTKMF